MEYNESKEILRVLITKYETFCKEKLDENVLNYVFEELKNGKLPYISEIGNAILKDHVGLNEEKKPLTISELDLKYSDDCIGHIMLDSIICDICFRIRYANQLSKSDLSIDVVSLYKAVEKLSNRSLNLLYRYQILNVSDLEKINENNRRKIKMLGNTGLLEVKLAQEVINGVSRIDISTTDETNNEETEKDELSSVKEELKDTQSKALSMLFGYKKILELMKKKQELQKQLAEIDNEITQIINSKMEPGGDFGHGLK